MRINRTLRLMPNALGIIQIVPIKTFDETARRAMLIEGLVEPDQLGMQVIGDRSDVSHAIHREGKFVVETDTQTLRATLGFFPDHAEEGGYEIHRSRRPVEKGKITNVHKVSAYETSSLLSILAPFPVRYRITTVALERPYTCLVWLVGLNSFRTVEPEE